MLGSNFSKALAFYLDNYKAYLSAIEDICRKIEERSPVEFQETHFESQSPRPSGSLGEDSGHSTRKKIPRKEKESLAQETVEKNYD